MTACLSPQKRPSRARSVFCLMHPLGALGFYVTERVVVCWHILELRCVDGGSQKDAGLLLTLPHKNSCTFLPKLTRGAAVRLHRN